jgi:hypothetical protein
VHLSVRRHIIRIKAVPAAEIAQVEAGLISKLTYFIGTPSAANIIDAITG